MYIRADAWDSTGNEVPYIPKRHKRNAQRINKNNPDTVKTCTKEALRSYKERHDIEKALRILREGLKGIDDTRGSLLLSLAFPDTVPFFSEALYQWINWDRETGWTQKCRWDNDAYKVILRKVDSLKKRYLQDGLRVKAIDVEKVVFVLKHETPTRGTFNYIYVNS